MNSSQALWQWDPVLLLWIWPIVFVYIGLLYLSWQGRPTSAHWRWHSPVLFALGLAVVYVTFASPLNTLGTYYLFSVRMIQHILLIYAIAFLLLAGIPPWTWQYLSERWAVFRLLLQVGTHPYGVAILFNLVFTLWHIPFLFEASLHYPLVQLLERLSLGFVAFLMWVPLLCPLGLSRLQPTGQMLYLIALMMGQFPILGCLVLSRSLWYPTYALAPSLTSWDTLTDQLVGGLILKFVTVVIFGLMLMKAFLNWAKLEEMCEELEAAYLRESATASDVLNTDRHGEFE